MLNNSCPIVLNSYNMNVYLETGGKIQKKWMVWRKQINAKTRSHEKKSQMITESPLKVTLMYLSQFKFQKVRKCHCMVSWTKDTKQIPCKSKHHYLLKAERMIYKTLLNITWIWIFANSREEPVKKTIAPWTLTIQ